MVVRGVPHRLAKDAWWLDDTTPPKGFRAGPVLVLAVILADLLVWNVLPGLSLAVWVLCMGGLIAVTFGRKAKLAMQLRAWVVLLLAVLPLIEVLQLSSFFFALIGLMAFSVIMAEATWDGAVILRAIRRLPGYGLVRVFQDVFVLRIAVPSKGSRRNLFLDWALPASVGFVFVGLFALANPLADAFVVWIGQIETGFSLSGWRFVFWAMVGTVVWSLLCVPALMPQLTKPRLAHPKVLQSGFVNDRSVLRALIVFNVIFLVQTASDLGYLWGGVALPEGLSYAQYAHRGAYPLLATALLAGVFALLSQPYLDQRAWLRGLLYLWIAQNVLLVVSSILRLDLYIDVYGLTRLRVAALVWMVVVALGLVLIVMQMMARHSLGWFWQRVFGLGLVALYACSLVNIDGLIARHNLARPDRLDRGYICRLSEGAVPAVAGYNATAPMPICHSRYPRLSTPQDWREWGYRNARLRRSLAAMEDVQ